MLNNSDASSTPVTNDAFKEAQTIRRIANYLYAQFGGMGFLKDLDEQGQIPWLRHGEAVLNLTKMK